MDDEYRISDIIAQTEVIKAVKIYGIEGTEDKIKKLYARNPKLKEVMLNALRDIYFKKP